VKIHKTGLFQRVGSASRLVVVMVSCASSFSLKSGRDLEMFSICAPGLLGRLLQVFKATVLGISAYDDLRRPLFRFGKHKLWPVARSRDKKDRDTESNFLTSKFSLPHPQAIPINGFYRAARATPGELSTTMLSL
jgi:hypothetical protein